MSLSSPVLAILGGAAMAVACSSGTDGPQNGGETQGSTGASSSATPSSSGVSSSGASTSTSSATSSSGTDDAPGTTSSSSGSTGGVGGSASTSSASSGAVSFASDVLVPVFQATCTSPATTCHGDPSVVTASMARPYLGPHSGTLDAATVQTILSGLSKPSAEDPSMPLVTPGDSTQSYLMYKMDGTQSSLDCSAGNDNGGCGAFMPNMAISILPKSKRDTVRAWIDEGAPDN